MTLPAYLDVEYSPSGGAAGSLNDYTLRFGEVVAAYSPRDPQNRGVTRGKQWVYIVNVNYRDSTGPRAIVPYRCTVAEMFGGVGDHLRYSVRRTAAEAKGGKFGLGARVLVLCPNGDKSQALIIGALRHEQDTAVDPEGAFLDFAFNGVKFTIAPDGSLTLVVGGPTNVDGTPSSSDAKPTSVTVKPDGSVALTSTKVDVKAQEVNVDAEKVNLGGKEADIDPQDYAVVGSGIDTFTGTPYFALGNTSQKVKVKK